MPLTRSKLLAAMLLCGTASGATSCTIAKPVVCAVTTPIYVLGNSGCYGCDPRGALCGLLVFSAIGAAGGFVTGVITDVQYLMGDVDDPFRHLHEPFVTDGAVDSAE